MNPVSPKGTSTGRRVAAVAIGVGAGQALVAAASPLLTRLYDPEEIGVLAIYSAIVATIVPAASFRYETAIPLPRREDDAANLFTAALIALLITAALVLGALILWGESRTRDRLGVSPQMSLAIPAGVVVAGSYQALSLLGVRREAFVPLGASRAVQGGSQALVQSALGVANAGVPGLVGGDLIGRSLSSVFLGWKVHPLSSIRLAGWANLKAQVRRYWRFPVFGTWSALANSAGLHLSPFLVALTYGPRAAGWYAIGQRVMGLPTTIVGQGAAQVYLSDAANEVRVSIERLAALFSQTLKRMTLLGGLVFVPVFLLAPAVFPRLFGENWATAGEIVQVSVPMFFAQFVVVPVSNTLNVLERQDLQLGWDLTRLGVSVGVFLIARTTDLPLITGIGLFSASMTASYVALVLLIQMVLRRRTSRGSSDQE
jgi:O-antigen/teichoic acid export membrane protein